DRKDAAIVAVYQVPGSNAVEAANDLKKLMEELKARLPQDVDYAVSLDTTQAVSEGMKEIVLTLIIAIALVIVVVFVFLQGWRATLIPLLFGFLRSPLPRVFFFFFFFFFF